MPKAAAGLDELHRFYHLASRLKKILIETKLLQSLRSRERKELVKQGRASPANRHNATLPTCKTPLRLSPTELGLSSEPLRRGWQRTTTFTDSMTHECRCGANDRD